MNNDTTPTPRGALFDLDGVLIDSEGIYTEFWQSIDDEFHTGVDNFALAIKGTTLDNILSTYFSQDDYPEILRRLKMQEQEMVYRLFPGAEEVLDLLRAAGWRTAIVTSSNPAKMEGLFSQVPSLRTLVDTIITDHDVQRSKPDPQGYLLAASRLGCRPADCLVFEDSLQGIEAGRRAGARVIGIATTNPRSAVEPVADLTLDTIADFDLTLL